VALHDPVLANCDRPLRLIVMPTDIAVFGLLQVSFGVSVQVPLSACPLRIR
jgi:hypothetical protein